MPRKKPMAPAEIARKGGHARAKSMSPQARRKASQAASAIRWQRYRDLQDPVKRENTINELRARLVELEGNRNAET